MNQLNETYEVVDDIFKVFENVRSLFHSWDKSKHMTFIQEVMKLQALEVRLYELGYDDDFVRLLMEAVYESIFSRAEIQQYSGAVILSAAKDLWPGEILRCAQDDS